MMGMKGVGQAMLKAIAEGRVPKPEEAGITATEVAQRLKDAEKTARERLANAYRDAFIAEFGETKPVVRTAGVVEREAAPIDLSAIYAACKAIMQAGYEPRDFSIVIPGRDFCQLLGDLSFKVKGDPAETSTMRVHDLEILRGDAGIGIFGPKMIESSRKALDAEILRCLGRGGITELPKSTSGDRVRASAEPIGKIPVTPSPAGGDDRDSNSLAHLSDEAKVIAAKHAIAAYARNKQLPSAAHLALFGELDGKRAGNKGSDEPPTSGRLRSAFSVGKWGGIRWVATDFAAPGADKTVAAIRRADGSIVATNLPAGTVVATAIGDKFASFTVLRDATGETEIFSARIVDDIKRNDHSLSAEPLGRAVDQVWVRENGGAYADLISSRAERLAEMVCRGDSTADGEWR